MEPDLRRRKMRVIINGYLGHMGRQVAKLVSDGYRGAEFAKGVDVTAANDASDCVASLWDVTESADCIVDFSNHACTAELTSFAAQKGLPLIIATTGQTEDELQMIKEASEKIPVFIASNFSLGIAILAELARKVAAAMPEAEIEIIEKHHDRKMDAPSGTALTLAKVMSDARGGVDIVTGRSGFGKRTPEEIGISSVRMGNIVGEHEIMIGTPNQTITLKHEAHDRALFAEGALAAADFLVGKGPGLYGMEDLVGENR